MFVGQCLCLVDTKNLNLLENTVLYSPRKTWSISGGNTFRPMEYVSGDKVSGSLETVSLHRLILPPYTLLRAVTVTDQVVHAMYSDGMKEGKTI